MDAFGHPYDEVADHSLDHDPYPEQVEENLSKGIDTTS